MEYFRDPRNQIQASIAYRLGMIANQYRAFPIPAKKDFSVTLDVCILQNLLTTCTELLKSMARNEHKASFLTANIEESAVWGLRPDMIEINTFVGKLTGEVVLKRLRNALSHPCELNIHDVFPSTGYTTLDESDTICRFCFVNSPDTMKGRPKSFDEDEARRQLDKLIREGEMPKDVDIIRDERGGFCFGRSGKPFARVFKIYLTVEEIHALVIGLSNHLAQPSQESWDGSTITLLVA